ncbi:MAG: LysR family transcriptional regulator, partial [Ilumatobacteraceae bacterium]
MDLRQLNTLIAIADHGSFSAAARALFTVQSNVSAHISRLEKELGATLIDRQTGRMTEDGNRVLERARRIMHEMDDIRSDMESNDHDVSGDVRLGVIGTIARWAIPPVLRQMSETHPRVHTVVTEGSSSALVPNVVSGLLNAAILHLPIDDPDLIVEPLFDEELLLLAPPEHPLAQREEVDI